MKLAAYQRLGAYTQTIPGITVFTPNTQLNHQQSPRLGRIVRLGDATATDTPVNTVQAVPSPIDKAIELAKAYPLPAAGLFWFLFLRK